MKRPKRDSSFSVMTAVSTVSFSSQYERYGTTMGGNIWPASYMGNIDAFNPSTWKSFRWALERVSERANERISIVERASELRLAKWAVRCRRWSKWSRATCVDFICFHNAAAMASVRLSPQWHQYVCLLNIAGMASSFFVVITASIWFSLQKTIPDGRPFLRDYFFQWKTISNGRPFLMEYHS